MNCEPQPQAPAEEGVPSERGRPESRQPEHDPQTSVPAQDPQTPAEGVPSKGENTDSGGAGAEDGPRTAVPASIAASPSPVHRAVSMKWLKNFVTEHRGKRFCFERREYLAPADGGGSSSGLDVHPDTLEAHRSARRAAEVAGTGQPVTVRYKDIVFETMTTADVMEAIIRPVARDRHASFAEAKISRQATGSPTYFVSHAWDSLFVDLVDSLAAYLEGAAQDETFPWLDIFAINQDDSGGQFSAMDELDDGATLKQVIELSQATLVVLDKDRVAPLARLWCLYEIGSTPPSKLQLLTHGFSEKDISQHIWKINAGGALCYDDKDRQMIQASIINKFGSLDQFTTELRLRLLLRPMSYAADLQALRNRGGDPEQYSFEEVQQHVEAAPGQVACVIGGPGEGKSTLAAMMSPTESDGGTAFVQAAHFCKRSDTSRQDIGAIARSLGYQIAQHVDHSDSLMFGLTADEAETVQTDPDAAVQLLVIRQLEGLAAAGRRVVLLVDALDEAQERETNPVVRMLQRLGKARTHALSLVVTMRPQPEANKIILQSAFGSVREFSPAQLRRSTESLAMLPLHDSLAPEWHAALRANARSKIYVTACLGYVQAWIADGRSPHELRAPPGDIDSAYRYWFELQPPTPDVQQLLAVVMAAREPLSSAHLDALGLLQARDRLPGWGLLFDDREHLLQTLHLSIREFLTDPDRSGVHTAKIARGHVILARSCLRILKGRTSGPLHTYALRHGHVHLTDMLSHGPDREHDQESRAVLHEWTQTFLQPRASYGAQDYKAEDGCGTALCDTELGSTTQSDEPEPETASMHHDRPLMERSTSQKSTSANRVSQSYMYSPWQAQAFTTSWLERQAEQGRSKLLLPELLSLEAKLRLLVDSEAWNGMHSWLHGLLQLVQHLRWGIGTFWAPHFDTNPTYARSTFAANFCVTGPLHHSDVQVALAPHQKLCMPHRVAISPTIHQLVGHSDAVNSAQFSPDGTNIVSASHDQTVRVWSVATGECVQTLEGHSNGVSSAQFSPDGTNIVSASDDKTVRVWSVATGECVQTLEGHSNGVSSAQFSPDGTNIVSASDDKTVRVWSVATGECVQTLEGHSSAVSSAQFSPDGTNIVSASEDKTVRVWSVATGECVQTLEGHSDGVSSAQFSPDGTNIVSASGDKTVRVWSVATGECVQTLEGHSGGVSSAQFSPDGTNIVSASEDKTVRVWSVATGECVQTLEGHSGGVSSAQFSPDGTNIVSASQDKTVRVWSVATGECVQTLEGHSNGVSSAQFSPDGTNIVSASDDKTVRVWSVATGECVQTLEGHSSGVSSAQFSPDGTNIVSASYDKTVRVWSVATGECVQTLEGHSGGVSSAQFSPDGTNIVSASGDKTVRVWSVATGECVQTLEGHSGGVSSAQFSPDGTNIVSASDDKTVRVWSVATGECVQTLEGHSNGVSSAQFSPDGTNIVSASDDQTVRVWSVATGECVQTLEGHSNGVNSAQFSPDGTNIVSASDDQTVRVWSVATGECVQTLEGHSNGVNSAQFSPDGTNIVSASGDKTVRVWSVATGECVQTLEGHSNGVSSAQFSPDGTNIVSASEDKTVRVWEGE